MSIPKKSIREWESLKVCKGDFISTFQKEYRAVDTALPQGWLDKFSGYCKQYKDKLPEHLQFDDYYGLILSTTFYVYDEHSWGRPETICTEVEELMAIFNERIFV